MASFLRTRDYNRAASEASFSYERCTRCGLISLANVPADLAIYYAAGYHDIPSSTADLERGAEHDRYKIEMVRRFATGGRLLEIGPGWGAFCLLAQRAGFDVEAIEMDERCCEFLRDKLGVRAIHAEDAAAALEMASSADVIALWHVLEHIPDPWTLLEAAARKLSAGGVLLIATPNPRAAQFRLFGRFWAHLDAPRHVHLLPSSALSERAAGVGLSAQSITTRDPGSLGWNDFGWRFSLANLSPARVLKRPLRLAGRLIAHVAAPLERAEGKGSAYTAVFRKAPGR